MTLRTDGVDFRPHRRGNLAVKVNRRSADDRFGHSSRNLLDNKLGLVQSQDDRDALQRSIVKLLDAVSDVHRAT